MNRNDTITDDILVKYLLDEAQPNERARVEKWVQASGDNQKYFDVFRLIIEKSQLNPQTDIDEHTALERLHARIQRESSPVKKQSVAFRRFIQVAASVVLVVSVGWLAYVQFIRNKEMNIRATTTVLTQTLPDGSVAILNKNSRISYPERFTGNTRQINLTGEAFFKVQPDKTKPFIIRVNDVTVKVVGTSFNVKSRSGKTTVTVETGIVRVSRANKSVALRPGEKVQVIGNQANLVKEVSKGRLYNYYYSHELVCDKTPLHELVETLNEKYNADIVIANPSLQDLPISTVFNDEPLDNILDVIAGTFNIRVERKGEQILLR